MKSREWIKTCQSPVVSSPVACASPHHRRHNTTSTLPWTDWPDWLWICENKAETTAKQISDVQNEPEIGRWVRKQSTTNLIEDHPGSDPSHILRPILQHKRDGQNSNSSVLLCRRPKNNTSWELDHLTLTERDKVGEWILDCSIRILLAAVHSFIPLISFVSSSK